MYKLKPTKTAKHYTLWSRKGNCPGCGAGCGSKHELTCTTRINLLKEIGKDPVLELLKLTQQLISQR